MEDEVKRLKKIIAEEVGDGFITLDEIKELEKISRIAAEESRRQKTRDMDYSYDPERRGDEND